MPHDRPPDGVDPVFFLFIGIRDEERGLVGRRQLEGVRPVDGVLGSLDGEAAVDVDDAPRDGVLLKRWWVGRGRKREEEEVEFISR